LKDHSARYAQIAIAFARRGVAVYAFDLRGHGRSAGERVVVRAFDDYLDDLDVFVRNVANVERNKPLFLFGHSMGGAIVTLYAIEKRPRLAGLVTSGAALEVDAPGALVVATEIFGEAAPGLAVLKLDLK